MDFDYYFHYHNSILEIWLVLWRHAWQHQQKRRNKNVNCFYKTSDVIKQSIMNTETRNPTRFRNLFYLKNPNHANAKLNWLDIATKKHFAT